MTMLIVPCHKNSHAVFTENIGNIYTIYSKIYVIQVVD